MYETSFGLREEPFRLTSDPRFFYLAEPHAAALSTVVEAVTRRKGLAVVTGPCGTGKTMVAHAALDILSDRAKTSRPISTAFVFNPTLSSEEFLEMTLAEFAVSCTATSKPARLTALHQMLLERRTQGGTSLLLVDDAHLLTEDLIEEILLLSNADAYTEKLLQIVLCGLPELLALLSRPESRGLRQRIASSCSLRPLVFEEFEAYVAARLHAAGFRGAASPFPRRVRQEIFRRAEGVPRVINLFCDACLTIGCNGKNPLIDLAVVEEAAFELGMSEAYIGQRPATDSAKAEPVFAPVVAPETADTMRSIIVNSSPGAVAVEEVRLEEPSPAASAAKSPAFVSVECPPVETVNPIAVRESEAISTPTESSNVCVFSKDLNPVPLAPEQKHEEQHAERELSLELSADCSGAADPLTTEKMPNPVTVLSAAPISFGGLRTENAAPPTAHRSRIPLAKKRAVTSIHEIWLSWKWGSLFWINRFLLSIFLAFKRAYALISRLMLSASHAARQWVRVPVVVLRKISQVGFSTRLLLWRCWFDFNRHWSAMSDVMALPEMESSLFHWLRQPIRPKMESSLLRWLCQPIRPKI